MGLKSRHDEEVLAFGDDPQSVEVYPWDQPLRLIDTAKTPDRDFHGRNKGVFDRLKEAGNRRTLLEPVAASIEPGLLKLKQNFPNFSEVINFVRNQFLLARRQGRALHLPPMLLSGPPGVGKTHLCDQLAKFIGTKLVRISFDSAQTSSVLLGSAKHWGNTTFGVVFETVCLGSVANPMFLLDEIDKVGEGQGYQNPTASLHSLLEPVSANRVKDISLDFEFDASKAMWIAASNDPTVIPTSLRSRFVEFKIDVPQGAQALDLARILVSKAHRDISPHGFSEPDYSIAKLVAHMSPREQRQALERAYASAVECGRNQLLKQDLPAEVFEDDGPGDVDQVAWLH